MIPLRRRDGASVVAVYHFVTNNAGRTEDLGAMDLVDDAAAIAFGNEVIRDLIHGAAKQYTGRLPASHSRGQRRSRSKEIKESPRAGGRWVDHDLA
jgi:hypothetical protein